jgi:hypothetical protein
MARRAEHAGDQACSEHDSNDRAERPWVSDGDTPDSRRKMQRQTHRQPQRMPCRYSIDLIRGQGSGIAEAAALSA